MSLAEKSIIVIDGGFSSQLAKYAANFEKHPLWTALVLYENPELVYQTHMDYLRAGADIIETNSYQASIEGFQKYIEEDSLTDSKCRELIERAAKLATDARETYLSEQKSDKKILVAGSVGPYGAFLHDGSEYNGSYLDKISAETIREWHKPRIEALFKGGVDLLAFETMPGAKEAEILVELLKDYPDAKAWLSFSCRDNRHTNYGDNFQTVAKKCFDLNPEQLVAVGVNCTNPDYIEGLFVGFNQDRKSNPVPLIVYSNSGEIYVPEKGWAEKEICKQLESYVEKWINLGVKYIGGCCRTSEESIRKIREEVEKYSIQLN